MNKTEFDNKPASFNKQITSIKGKHLEVEIYFRSNDGSQNIFTNQHLMC